VKYTKHAKRSTATDGRFRRVTRCRALYSKMVAWWNKQEAKIAVIVIGGEGGATVPWHTYAEIV